MEGNEFHVEIKTVNHRYSDVFIKMPRQIGYLEERVRELVGKAISRGKMDVFITYSNFGDDSKCVMYDEHLAKAYISAVEAMRDKFGLKDDISVSLISKYPDVLKIDQNEEDEEKIWEMLKAAVENALDSLVNMREKEGLGLKNDLLQRIEYIEKTLQEIIHRAPDVIKEYKLKLEARVKDMLEQQNVDENRIAMEIVMFSDRCGIDEEIVRLTSHLKQMRDTLNNKQPIGRKLDFLIQEMNREINTIGSKANDLTITKNVVEIKCEIEKMREQVQNIE